MTQSLTNAAGRTDDLAWCIASPPLLTVALSPHHSWSAAQYQALWQAWQPTVPATLALPTRLGRRFEALWQYWLQAHPHWQMLSSGLIVRQQQQTVGEFDLLVRDRRSDHVEHWELAVKFYFGDGDLQDPSSWWGLARQDRLDRKLAKLHTQLQLATTAPGQQTLQHAGIRVAATRAIVKGRLFYPLAARAVRAGFAGPDHLRGYWATSAAWLQWCAERERPLAQPYARSLWLQQQLPANDWLPLAECLQQASTNDFQCYQLQDGQIIAVLPATWSSTEDARTAASQA